jgi:alpha-glucosidase (family GH31 glycosyl hydrolase)
MDLSTIARIPLVRALFLELDGLNGTENIQDQFFLGSDIIVAPFMQAEPERKYFLPKG